MTTLLVFAVVISILVVVHELGHHLMAKWFGVPVEVFSVGFGPKLLAIRRGETEYRLSAIPFGGYVKMAGTSPVRGDPAPNGFDSKAAVAAFPDSARRPGHERRVRPGAGRLSASGSASKSQRPTVPSPPRSTGPSRSARFLSAVQAIADSSAEILSTLGGLLTGQLSPSHLIGPVGLAQIAGESAQLGWRAMLAAMAFISLNLGICNLLPIPILDGGHMLMLLFEGITRRNVPFRVRKALLGAGAAGDAPAARHDLLQRPGAARSAERS